MSRRKKKLKAQAKLSIWQQWRAWYETKGAIFRFCLKLGLLMALFYGELALPNGDRWLYSYLEANAWASNLILNLLGQHTALSGVTIASAKFSVTIERGCDAVEPTWLFCAAVLSFPSPWKDKAIGMLVGIILLQLFNLLRIVTLFCIGAFAPSIFNASHMEVWPAVFVILAIVLFIGWKDWTSMHQPHATV